MATNLTEQDVRDYHIGMTFEDAWRSYAGMVETGEFTLKYVLPLVPQKIAAELTSYFASVATGTLDGDYE
jgi:hypothetical protein